jgi:hypothetical protein
MLERAERAACQILAVRVNVSERMKLDRSSNAPKNSDLDFVNLCLIYRLVGGIVPPAFPTTALMAVVPTLVLTVPPVSMPTPKTVRGVVRRAVAVRVNASKHRNYPR